jgi:hypothetical protein
MYFYNDIWNLILSFLLDNFNISVNNIILSNIPFNEYTFLILNNKKKLFENYKDDNIFLLQDLINCTYIESFFFIHKNKNINYNEITHSPLTINEFKYVLKIVKIMDYLRRRDI